MENRNLKEEGETPVKGRPPGRRDRTAYEMARDKALIVRLKFVNKLSYEEIEHRVNLAYADEGETVANNGKVKTPPHVGRKLIEKIITQATEEADKESTDIILAVRKRLVREYEALQVYLMERYEASTGKESVVTEEEKETDGDKSSTTSGKKTVTKEARDGDARYLDLIERCKWRIAELTGAAMPKKTALTNPDGTEAYKFEGLNEFKRLEALREELTSGKPAIAVLPPGSQN